MSCESVDKILNAMTLPQKVGQMFCLGFCGRYPHRDILDIIDKYQPAGFRVTPSGRKFARYLPDGHPGADRVVRPPELLERVYGVKCLAWQQSLAGYAKTLNTLRARALESGAGVPLYFSLDFEGDSSADLWGQESFGVPSCLGIARHGDLDLARDIACAVARQLRAVGINSLHSPSLDVNTCENNPEIGERSFSDDPDVCSQFGLAMLKGYRDGGVWATAKHFPGRGESTVDAHFEVPVIDCSREVMNAVHMAPYRVLVEGGLPAIMLAHTVYPALDATREIATLSKPIVSGILRDQLGFDGIVMTDSFTMGGLVARYEVVEAVLRSIEAGVDVVLLKDETALRGETIEGVIDAVRSGRIGEDRIHASAQRVLKTKAEYGLLDGSGGIVDPEAVSGRIRSAENLAVAARANRASVSLLRSDEPLPIAPGARVLVIEQCSGFQRLYNDEQVHVGTLYEALLERGCDALYTDYDGGNLDAIWSHVEILLSHIDVIVHTGYFQSGHSSFVSDFERIEAIPVPSVFVTNSPYPHTVSPIMKNVILRTTQCKGADEAVAELIMNGRLEEAR